MKKKSVNKTFVGQTDFIALAETMLHISAGNQNLCGVTLVKLPSAVPKTFQHTKLQRNPQPLPNPDTSLNLSVTRTVSQISRPGIAGRHR